MRLNIKTIDKLSEILAPSEVYEVIKLAASQDKIEAKWKARVNKDWKYITSISLESLEEHGRITRKIEEDIQDRLNALYAEHFFYVVAQGYRSTNRGQPTPRLSRQRIPRSLAEIRKLWDLWRKKKEIPKRQEDFAKKVKKAFLDKCQSSWKKYSEDYRNGDTGDKKAIIDKIQSASETVRSRATMIVETETTRYWNQVRRSVYDEASDVTHYLFIAVRDFATTAWCFNGKRPHSRGRGRGGLIYAKQDPLLKAESPPCHWNCRSELLPLTKMNPKHVEIINDKSRWRRNHSCEPLPPGWNAA